MMMPKTLKLSIANDLGLEAANERTTIPAPVSRRTMRASDPQRRSTRPWAIALTIAAAILLALTGVLRWGMPTSDNEPDNRFLFSSPAVPTVASTPAASPESSPVADQSWLQPTGIDDCPEGLLDPAQSIENPSGRHYSGEDYAAVSTDRAYGPYSVPSDNDAVEVAEAQRLYAACGWSTELTRPLWTARFEYEMRTPEGRGSIDWAGDTDAQELSAWYQDELGLTVDDVVFEVEMKEVGLDSAGPDHITVGYLPEHAVQLSDGRIAVPESQVTYRSEVITREHRPTFLLTTASVYMEFSGEWLLDEYIPICIGDCEEYWQERESAYADQATPVASPEVSDEYDASWMLPVDPDVCTTVADTPMMEGGPQDFDSMPRREYNIIGPANTADALDANQTARLSQACDDPKSLWSTRLASDNGLSREQLSPFTVVLLQQQWEDGQVVSDALEANGMQPTDFTLVAGGDNPMFAEVEDGTYWLTNPYMALALEDGRIVMPWVEILVSKDDMSGSRIESPFIGTALVLLEENGEWKIDGQLPICVGECDEVWPHLHEILMDALWLMPISVEECERNDYLPADISESSAAAVKSRQFVACEVGGDAGPLQGPEYRVTKGENARPLSEEIVSLHRANDQTPGSLQRIAQTYLWPEDADLPTDPWAVFQPGSVVTLEDGRVAVLESTVVTPDGVAGSGRISPVVTTALVWSVEGDSWLVDEEVTVCLSNLGHCDAFWGDEPVATPESTPVAVVIPETCEASDEFAADFTSHDRLPIQLRPEPISQAGVYVEVLKPRAPLQYLCESKETSHPAQDRMDEGQQWLKIRTEDGTEGWIREMDVREYEP